MAVNNLAIVQARMGSTRLPCKVLKEVNGKSLIEILFHRLSNSKKIDKLILATSQNTENDLLVETIEKLGFETFRGSENDVLDRYYKAAMRYIPQAVVRITGDCPLIDPHLVDEVISIYEQEKVDYVSNTNPPTYPDGLDTEIFSFEALKIAHDQAKKPFDRETMIKSVAEFNQWLVDSDNGRVQLVDWITQDGNYPTNDQLLGGHHHMGGTRMHKSLKFGVVDSNCKVHGSENLYIAGSSVFTTGGHNNPTLPIVQLSLRLADHLIN